jgi:importin subunit alpha-1
MSVLPDVCWALSYISDGDDDRIDAVMNTGITPALISMLTHADAGVVTPVLRTLGNFVSGNERQTQAVVNAGIIDVIPSLLNHPKKNIRKEACWLLSNIAAGNSDQISAVISKASMMQTVLNLLEKAEWDVRKEAAWVVSNIATGGLTSHVHDLVEFGAINALCSVISAADPKILLVILDAIDSILRVGKSSDRDYAGYVDECDGLDAIENLQTHENDNVYEKAVAIIETYFGVEEGEDENLVPEVHGDTFSFGLPVNKATDGIQQQQAPLQPFNF